MPDNKYAQHRIGVPDLVLSSQLLNSKKTWDPGKNDIEVKV